MSYDALELRVARHAAPCARSNIVAEGAWTTRAAPVGDRGEAWSEFFAWPSARPRWRIEKTQGAREGYEETLSFPFSLPVGQSCTKSFRILQRACANLGKFTGSSEAGARRRPLARLPRQVSPRGKSGESSVGRSYSGALLVRSPTQARRAFVDVGCGAKRSFHAAWPPPFRRRCHRSGHRRGATHRKKESPAPRAARLPPLEASLRPRGRLRIFGHRTRGGR